MSDVGKSLFQNVILSFFSDIQKLDDKCQLKPSSDAKSSHSTNSDISDYMETLSMSSHSSGGGDVDVNNHQQQTTMTAKNRPRTGKEYHVLDRTILQHDESLSPRCKSKTNHDQDSTTPFVFQKDQKEINYLEVDPGSLENGPRSPAIKPEAATQYAVIDVVATKAARRIGTERERRYSVESRPGHSGSNPASPKLKQHAMTN